jgi:hypothetical protein
MILSIGPGRSYESAGEARADGPGLEVYNPFDVATWAPVP